MNIKYLQKQLRTPLRLRPLPVRINAEGETLPNCDDGWFLEQIREEEPTGVTLTNTASGHILELRPDNIKEWRSPDFLLLRCKVIIHPQAIEIEPIYGNNDIFVRLEHQIPALLAEMRNDLAHFPLRRECVLLSKHWGYWSKGNEFLYFFEEHDDLLSQFQILVNNGLVVDIKYNSVDRFTITEKLAEYLGA
jgi:hypothetical protein